MDDKKKWKLSTLLEICKRHNASLTVKPNGRVEFRCPTRHGLQKLNNELIQRAAVGLTFTFGEILRDEKTQEVIDDFLWFHPSVVNIFS